MTTDIKKHGWIEKLPERWRPYVYLGRFDRPIGAWLLLLPGWCGIALASAAPWQEWRLFALFGLGAIVMRAAGCVINDIWDRDLDRKVARTRTRPLAARTVSLRAALLFLFVLLLVGLAVLLQMNIYTIILGLISVPFIAVYPLMKRITWWPQLFLGLTFNFSALMGWSAVTGGLSLAPILFYAGCMFWTLGYDTVYAHQDKEDDALVGIKSTALKFADHPRVPVIIFYTIQTLLWGSSFLLSQGWHGAVFFVPVIAHQIWQLKIWNPENPESSLTIFKSNRDLGVMVFLVIFALSFF